MVVAISLAGELTISKPRSVVGWSGGTRFDLDLADALPDGGLFVVQRGEGEGDPRIIVVQNWFEELKRKMAEAQ